MQCPKCKSAKLSVLNVLSAGDSAETRDLRCTECGYKSSSITILVPRAQDRGGSRRGKKGAWALAKRIKDGELRDVLDE